MDKLQKMFVETPFRQTRAWTRNVNNLHILLIFFCCMPSALTSASFPQVMSDILLLSPPVLRISWAPSGQDGRIDSAPSEGRVSQHSAHQRILIRLTQAMLGLSPKFKEGWNVILVSGTSARTCTRTLLERFSDVMIAASLKAQQYRRRYRHRGVAKRVGEC